MFRWIPYAFVRIVFFFIAGILLGIYLPDVIPDFFVRVLFVIFLTAYFVIVIVSWYLPKLKKATTIKLSAGFTGLITILITGYLTLLSHTDIRRQDHLFHIQKQIQFYKIVLISNARETTNTWKIEGEVSRVKIDGGWEKCSGKVLLYFSKNDFTIPYHYGDVLLIKGTPQIINSPANPGEFDYKRFLSFRNIYHQQFLRKRDMQFVAHTPPSLVMEYTLASRNWANNTLKKYVTGQREQAIVTALVLGVTDGLDNELLNAYAATGTIHVLAVSGLHVGIIYWILLLLLKPLNKTTSGKWILALISIIVLWSYAFVTGLSPSVLRAVAMFSFVALSRPASQSTNIYNTLALSAFVLLLYNPYLIMSVGFQLSYLAVLGIVYFHPRLYRLWEPETKVLSFIWETTSISIAAQLGTFPLCLMYFHQFPSYFIISNLFVIPISSIVLILGLVLLVVNVISNLAVLVGYLLTMLIKLMNFIVFAVDSLPFSLIKNVYINAMQCWFILAIIISIILLSKYRKFSYVLMIAFFIALYSGVQWISFIHNTNHQKIAVYHIKGHKAIDLFSNGTAYFITDSTLHKSQNEIDFHITPNRLINGIGNVKKVNETNLLRSFSGCKVVCWKGIRLLNIDERTFVSPLTAIDYLIISNNAVTNLEAIQHLNFKTLVIDSSNTWRVADNLKKQAEKQSIVMHSVLHDGAYSMNL